jgi:hypothetical protein
MSARVESTPIRESSWRPVLIAIVTALGLGALAVGMVRIAFDDDAPATASVQAPLWDAQKLEAMEGRVLAERVASTGAAVPALEPGELKAVLEGGFRAEQAIARDAVSALEPGELKAILEGRGPVGQVGAEDPSLTPHVPRHSPQE